MKILRCSRCRRRLRDSSGWNATVKAGVIVGVICPDCQTAEENAEAEINAATTIYSTDAFGRAIGAPK